MPSAWPDHVCQVKLHFLRGRYPDLRGSLDRLVYSGALRPATVEGLSGDWYVHRDSLHLLEASWQPRTVLLSPFDNLIADRRRPAELFGFEYTMEIYVPAARPSPRLLRHADPVRRSACRQVDPRFDRKTRRLIVNSIVLEPGQV